MKSVFLMKTNSNFKKLTINAPFFGQTDTITNKIEKKNRNKSSKN